MILAKYLQVGWSNAEYITDFFAVYEIILQPNRFKLNQTFLCYEDALTDGAKFREFVLK